MSSNKDLARLAGIWISNWNKRFPDKRIEQKNSSMFWRIAYACKKLLAACRDNMHNTKIVMMYYLCTQATGEEKEKWVYPVMKYISDAFEYIREFGEDSLVIEADEEVENIRSVSDRGKILVMTGEK